MLADNNSQLICHVQKESRRRAPWGAASVFWRAGFVTLVPQLLPRVLAVCGKRRDEHEVLVPDSQHHEILLIEPKIQTLVAVLAVLPDFDSRVLFMLDDRPNPRDSFAAAQVGSAVGFKRPFRDTVPKREFLALIQRLMTTANLQAASLRLRGNEVAIENGVDGVDVFQPIAAVVN